MRAGNRTTREVAATTSRAITLDASSGLPTFVAECAVLVGIRVDVQNRACRVSAHRPEG